MTCHICGFESRTTVCDHCGGMESGFSSTIIRDFTAAGARFDMPLSLPHDPTHAEVEAARNAYFIASDRGPIDANAWMRAALIAYEEEKGRRG